MTHARKYDLRWLTAQTRSLCNETNAPVRLRMLCMWAHQARSVNIYMLAMKMAQGSFMEAVQVGAPSPIGQPMHSCRENCAWVRHSLNPQQAVCLGSIVWRRRAPRRATGSASHSGVHCCTGDDFSFADGCAPGAGSARLPKGLACSREPVVALPARGDRLRRTASVCGGQMAPWARTWCRTGHHSGVGC
jgi:hypothetical protein